MTGIAAFGGPCEGAAVGDGLAVDVAGLVPHDAERTAISKTQPISSERCMIFPEQDNSRPRPSLVPR
jgi:hypothetical protein